MKTWVRFERGRDDIIGPTFGPYDYVQLTYGTLRISPNGDDLAVKYNGDWHVIPEHQPEEGSGRHYSDVIIYGADSLD